MTQEIFNEITAWQKATFPNATAESKIHHLYEEVKELMAEFFSQQRTKQRQSEFADCFMLLFGAAAADGMSYQDICNAINEKMEVNKKRKWGKPDANGVVRHISS